VLALGGGGAEAVREALHRVLAGAHIRLREAIPKLN